MMRAVMGIPNLDLVIPDERQKRVYARLRRAMALDPESITAKRAILAPPVVMDSGLLATLGPGMTRTCCLSRARALLQRCAERGGIAQNLHALDAGRGPAHDLDTGGWDAERLGQNAAQRAVRFSFERRRAQPRLHPRAAVGQRLGAGDGIAPALRRETHRHDQPIRLRAPRRGRSEERRVGEECRSR